MILLMSENALITLETWLARHADTQMFERGARLFAAGDTPARLYWVERGELQLVRHGAQGERIVVQRCTRGALAEASLFSPAYHCEGVAAVGTRAWVMPLAAFLDGLADAGIGRAFIRWQASVIRSLRGQCERLSLPRAEDRVLHYLHEHGRYASETGSLKHWAGALGMTHEHLYRTLAKLERAGRIRRDAHAVSPVGMRRPGRVKCQAC